MKKYQALRLSTVMRLHHRFHIGHMVAWVAVLAVQFVLKRVIASSQSGGAVMIKDASLGLHGLRILLLRPLFLIIGPIWHSRQLLHGLRGRDDTLRDQFCGAVDYRRAHVGFAKVRILKQPAKLAQDRLKVPHGGDRLAVAWCGCLLWHLWTSGRSTAIVLRVGNRRHSAQGRPRRA